MDMQKNNKEKYVKPEVRSLGKVKVVTESWDYVPGS